MLKMHSDIKDSIKARLYDMKYTLFFGIICFLFWLFQCKIVFDIFLQMGENKKGEGEYPISEEIHNTTLSLPIS